MKSKFIASHASYRAVLAAALLGVACESSEPGRGGAPDEATGKAIEYALDEAAALEREIRPGDSHSYELLLPAGTFFELNVEQRGVDVILRLFGTTGELLLEADLPISALGSETLMAVAETTGEYRLEIEAWKSETTKGTYVASIAFRDAGPGDRRMASAASLLYQAEARAWDQDHKGALAEYESALEQWRETDAVFWEAVTLTQKGAAERELGHHRRAIASGSQATTIFARLEKTRFEAISHFNVGYSHFALGEIDLAASSYRRSLELRRQGQDPRGEAIALAGLAEAYKVRGETQEALDHFGEALELLERAKDRRYRAIVLHDLGTLYRRVGNRQRALVHLTAAEAIYRELATRDSQAASLSQIGQVHFELGDFESALSALNASLALKRLDADPRGESVVLRKLGSVRLAMGDEVSAQSHYKEALALLRGTQSPRSRAPLLVELGSLYRKQGAFVQALDTCREAHAIFEDIGDPIGRTTALLGIARSHHQLEELSQARAAAEQALTISENLRIKPLSENLRLSFFSTVQQLFELDIDVLMELHRRDDRGGYAAAAFMVSERARSRSLLDLLSEAGAEIRADMTPELRARERGLQLALNNGVEKMEDETESETARQEATARVRAALDGLDGVRTAIRRQSPRYSALTLQEPLGFREIQHGLLDPETMLLQYRLGSERSYLWLVTNESLEAFELPAGEDIERAARRAHVVLLESHRRETLALTQDALCELGRMVLGPVTGKLVRKRLAIAADGAMHFVPFAALPDPDSGNGCFGAEPLVAAHEIVSLPSASAVAVLRQVREWRSEPLGQVAVLADPVFSKNDPRVTAATETDRRAAPVGSRRGEAPRGATPRDTRMSFPRLPYTKEEAEAILELVPPNSGILALGFEASKENVLSGLVSKHRIIHFATHGILDTAEPALSGVVLSQVDRSGTPVDGFLRAHEIYGLELQADLVVLGACETALGKEVRGEGLIGLARGFMYAGASRVVVSLWKVGDRGTSALMTSFYRALLEEGLGPVAALRAAQLEVRRQFPEPFHWAGFVLQGDWRDRGSG